MDKQQVLNLAKKVGINPIRGAMDHCEWLCVTPELLAFAEAVASAEREECAKTCDEIQAKTSKWGPMAGYCAEQIRMRSNHAK